MFSFISHNSSLVILCTGQDKFPTSTHIFVVIAAMVAGSDRSSSSGSYESFNDDCSGSSGCGKTANGGGNCDTVLSCGSRSSSD